MYPSTPPPPSGWATEPAEPARAPAGWAAAPAEPVRPYAAAPPRGAELEVPPAPLVRAGLRWCVASAMAAGTSPKQTRALCSLVGGRAKSLHELHRLPSRPPHCAAAAPLPSPESRLPSHLLHLQTQCLVALWDLWRRTTGTLSLDLSRRKMRGGGPGDSLWRVSAAQQGQAAQQAKPRWAAGGLEDAARAVGCRAAAMYCVMLVKVKGEN